MGEFDLNDDLLAGVDESVLGMATGQSTLPIPAPLFYVTNGSGVPNDTAPALQYGGWSVDAEAMDRVLDTTKRQLPSGLSKSASFSREGKELNVYSTRSLMVAPVAIRSSWVDKESGFRSPKYFDNARRHVQMLVIIATKDKTGLHVWGPAILSAKGYQAKNLLDSVDAWSKHLLPKLAEMNAVTRPALFWMPIGTFGDFHSEQVGTGRAKSAITPIKPFLPKLDKETLVKAFGGEELASAIVETHRACGQWLEAWRSNLQENIRQDGTVGLSRGGGQSGPGNWEPPF